MFLIYLLLVYPIYASQLWATMQRNYAQRDASIRPSVSDEHVAFIFAGSARSFVTTFVHTTIKQNLIHSYCPLDNHCEYDVFIRISSSDNNHAGDQLDSKGIYSPGSYKIKNDVINTLKTIIPPSNSNSRLYVDYFDIGSEREKEEMIAHAKMHPNTEMKHKVYRDLDSRRYSMYYNRWKAYDMMLRHEQTIGRNYTWVVMARLDTAFAAPVSSVHFYPRTKIYVPDTWCADVPDTFALLPRNISDLYFSLEKWMEPEVLCLGGPNLDPHSLLRPNLQRIGYNEKEIELVRQEDCFNKFKDHYNSTTGNTTWSEAGVSETFLYRKLRKYGFEIQQQTIELIPVFMTIIRLPLEPACLYVHPVRLILWGKATNAANAAMIAACHILNHDLKDYTAWNGSIGACHNNMTHPFDFFVAEHHHQASIRDSCLLHHETTDLNFLPFRMRHRSLCVTSSRYHDVMNMIACVNFYRPPGNEIMDMYDTDQLYYFYPLLTYPQRIYQYTIYPDEARKCLTVVIPSSIEESIKLLAARNDSSLSSYMRALQLNVSMLSCDLTATNMIYSIQKFSIQIIPTYRLNQLKVNIESKTNLKPLSSIQIKWTFHHPSIVLPQTYLYCMNYPYTNHTMNRVIVSNCRDSSTALSMSSNDGKSFSDSIILERAALVGPPYRSGIVVGKFPDP